MAFKHSNKKNEENKNKHVNMLQHLLNSSKLYKYDIVM